MGATGIEPVTPSMSTRCSPAELRALKIQRTRDGVPISALKQAGKDGSLGSHSGARHKVRAKRGRWREPGIQRLWREIPGSREGRAPE